MPIKVDILGGNPGLKQYLSDLDLEKPEENGKKYDDWASSVKDFPQIIDHKVWKSYLFSIHSVCCWASWGIGISSCSSRKRSALQKVTHTHTKTHRAGWSLYCVVCEPITASLVWFSFWKFTILRDASLWWSQKACRQCNSTVNHRRLNLA